MKLLMGWALVGISLILFSSRTLQGSSSDKDNLEAVATAFRSGNVNKLSPYLDSRVDISLPDKTDTYSKSQAKMVVGDFFNNHSVENFKVIRQGENGDFIFCTGLLQTTSGPYRITLFFKQKGGQAYVQEIRFEVGRG